MSYMLRSHEKLSKIQDGSGIPNFDITYVILRDGKPMGFFEHCAIVDRMNRNEDPAVIRRDEERNRRRFERFAQLRAASPDAEYEDIWTRIHDEEVEASEVEAARELEAA